jgi:hypothetical protein
MAIFHRPKGTNKEAVNLELVKSIFKPKDKSKIFFTLGTLAEEEQLVIWEFETLEERDQIFGKLPIANL